MSVRLMSAVFESRSLPPTERLIMLALADHADDDGRCYPSIDRLRQRTGLSERAVQTNIRALVAKGYVRIVIGGGKGNANLYFISANPAADAPRTKCTPAADAPQTPQEMRPNPAGDAPEPSGTIIEPSEERPREARRRRPEVPLPPDWTPSDRNIADASSQNFSSQDIDHEAGRFRDYHLARDTRFRDWDAAWRTWLGNARKFGRGGPATRSGNRADPALEQIARLAGLGQASSDGRPRARSHRQEA